MAVGQMHIETSCKYMRVIADQSETCFQNVRFVLLYLHYWQQVIYFVVLN